MGRSLQRSVWVAAPLWVGILTAALWLQLWVSLLALPQPQSLNPLLCLAMSPSTYVFGAVSLA